MAIGSSEPVSTSPPSFALLARYTLTPGVGVGPIAFGDRVAEHRELEPRHGRLGSIFELDEDYTEYTIAGLEDMLIVYADREDRVDSVGFYEHCLLDGRELIGMGVGELLVLLGLPSTIEAEQVGRELELLYGYDALGLTAWTIDGVVCVVQAGLGE